MLALYYLRFAYLPESKFMTRTAFSHKWLIGFFTAVYIYSMTVPTCTTKF